MKVITEKTNVYKFDELDKKIQNSIVEFKFMTQFKDVMGQILGNTKTFKSAGNIILKQCENTQYLKNGDIYRAR